MPCSPPSRGKPLRAVLMLALALVVVGIGLGMLVGHPYGPFRDIPPHFRDPIKAAIVVVVGILLLRLIERRWFSGQEGSLAAPSQSKTSLRFIIRLGLYVCIILVVIAVFGHGLSSLLVGGAFVTIIIGMTGQTLFGNLFAGLGIVFSHPFYIGERISFISGQFSLVASTFPHETAKPGYQGTVTDINLMYTEIRGDDGIPMTVPNGIIIQAAVENLSRMPAQKVRMRFDVDMAIPPEELTQKAQAALTDLGDEARVMVVDIGASTYSVAAQVLVSPDALVEEVRHQIGLRLVPMILACQQERKSG